MIKRFFFTLFAIALAFYASAQDNDTTIYTRFRLKSSKPEASSNFAEDGTPDYPVFDSAPKFETGLDAFYGYINRHLSYPQNENGSGGRGKVIVEAVIEKDGSLDRLKVVKSASRGFDKEALRVIAGSPKWKPAMYHGKPVRVKWNFTVNFDVEGGNN
jgi:TonB family protein